MRYFILVFLGVYACGLTQIKMPTKEEMRPRLLKRLAFEQFELSCWLCWSGAVQAGLFGEAA